MQNKKIYISPKADITTFHCVDVITASSYDKAKEDLQKTINQKREFLSTGTFSWSDGFKTGN